MKAVHRSAESDIILRVRADQVIARVLKLRGVANDTQDTLALQTLSGLVGGFLPWTVFSMRPAAILAILSDIEIYNRISIVECGSGNSTVYTARLLQHRGAGHLLSLEHDERWADLTRSWLARDGLEDIVTLVHAPLVDGWYDTSRIPATPPIDLLVVDGPPATTPATRLSRQPALHWLAERLSSDSSVILDDATRPGEREVLANWGPLYKRSFRVERGGYAISAPHTQHEAETLRQR